MPNWKKVITSGSDAQLNSLFVTGAVTASSISSSYIDLVPLTNGDIPSHKEGRIFFGQEDGALEVYNDEADITLQVGQEFWVRVYNDSGLEILNGTPCRVSGSQGDRLKAWPAISENHTGSAEFENHILGVSTHDIGDGEEGYITAQGIVRGVDTSEFIAGDILYLQTGSAGYRNTPPPFPYDIVQVGYVARSASPNGFIFVEPVEPVHFSNISGLSGSNPSLGDLWVYQSNNAWSPSNILPNIIASGSFTGSLLGNASTSTSASYATTASYSDTASFAPDYVLNSVTSSFATTGSNNFNGNQTITGSLLISSSTSEPLTVYGSGSTLFEVIGSVGSVFSIDDSLSGSLLSVSDISGIPQFEVFSDGALTIGSSPTSLYTTAQIVSTQASTNESIYSISTSSYDGAWFEYTAISASNLRAGSVMSIWEAGTSNINFTETTTTDIGDTSGVIVSAVITGSQAALQVNTTTSGWKLKTIVKSI